MCWRMIGESVDCVDVGQVSGVVEGGVCIGVWECLEMHG